MLRDLVKVANRLDSLGLTKEADLIDSVIQKKASEEDSPGGPGWEWQEPRHLKGFLRRLNQLIVDIFDAVNMGTNTIEEVIAENKESYLKFARWAEISEVEAMDILYKKIKESNLPAPKPEPPINRVALAKAFEDYVYKNLDEPIRVTDLSWRDTPGIAAYLINSEEVLPPSKKIRNKKKYYDEISIDENPDDSSIKIEGKDGKMYYFFEGSRIYNLIKEEQIRTGIRRGF
jgi:hypothetical protein